MAIVIAAAIVDCGMVSANRRIHAKTGDGFKPFSKQLRG
jgi:hypothetical protein